MTAQSPSSHAVRRGLGLTSRGPAVLGRFNDSSLIPEPWLLRRGFTTCALLAATTLLSALRRKA